MKEHCPTCGHPISATRDPQPRIMRWLIAKLATAPDGLTSRQLTQSIAGRDRKHLELTKQLAVQQGTVTIDTVSNRYALAH